jgi:hypothetical protein
MISVLSRILGAFCRKGTVPMILGKVALASLDVALHRA